MTNSIKIILGIGFFIFIVQFASGQTNKNIQFLEKLGIVDSLYSENLNDYRKIYVQFPDSYKANDYKKYPVVFILDGEVLLPAVNVVHQFYSGGFFPEMVLVGIDNSENRTRDLTPSVIESKYGMPFTQENGRAAIFYAFLENELIPYIEKKYPVTQYRTLIGHSYGGLFAIYTLLNHPQLFANYLAADPSLDWDNQKLLKEARQDKLKTDGFKEKSLYLSLSGQLHLQNANVTLANVMQDTTDFTLFSRSNIAFAEIVKQNKDIEFIWEFFPEDIHGTVALPSIRSGLISLFKWFQMENTDKFNSPETSREELSEIIQYRAKKLQNHFRYQVPPYPEDLLNTLGYMSLEMEQIKKAKMYFEFAISFYPQSSNAYDSMADFYERTNENANALKFVTKAYELTPNDYYKQRIKSLKSKLK